MVGDVTSTPIEVTQTNAVLTKLGSHHPMTTSPIDDGKNITTCFAIPKIEADNEEKRMWTVPALYMATSDHNDGSNISPPPS